MKRAAFLFAAFVLLTGNAVAEDTFGIYMPKYDIYNATPDVTERIVKYLKSDPDDIPLAKYPVIDANDIEHYDWDTHEITVKKTVWWRLRMPSVHGAPFVIVVNKKPVYVGAFWTNISSISASVPVVIYDHTRKSKRFRIDKAYPSAKFAVGEDPRSSARIRDALQKLGLLKERSSNVSDEGTR